MTSGSLQKHSRGSLSVKNCGVSGIAKSSQYNMYDKAVDVHVFGVFVEHKIKV